MRQLLPNSGQDSFGNFSWYGCLMGCTQEWQGVSSLVQCVIPADGWLEDLTVLLTTAPGGAASKTHTLYVNGNPTALSVQITGAAVTGNSLASVPVSAGDLVYLKSTPAGGPAASFPEYTLWFRSTTPGLNIFLTPFSGACPVAAPDVHYRPLYGTEPWISLPGAPDSRAVMPTDGSWTRIQVYRTVAPGVGQSLVFAVEVNGVEALTATLDGLNTTVSANGNVPVVPGDLVRLTVRAVGNPAGGSAAVSAVFVSTTPDETVILGVCNGTPSNAVNQSVKPYPIMTTWAALAGDPGPTTQHSFWQRGTVAKLWVYLASAPGAGNSNTITLRSNGAETGLSVLISDLAQTGHDTTHVGILADNNKLSLGNYPISLPLNGRVHWGFVMGRVRGGVKGGNMAPKLVAGAVI